MNIKLWSSVLVFLWTSNAYCEFDYEVSGAYEVSTTDSSQDHKDRDRDLTRLTAKKFFEPQKYSQFPASKVSVFTKSALIAVDLETYSTTPRDDLTLYSLKYDYGAQDINYRLFASVQQARHKTSYSSDTFSGGELGASWFFLDDSKATVKSQHLSGSHYKLERHELLLEQVFTRYDHDLVFDVRLGYEAYERPHQHLGRIGEGFRASYWGGRIGWFVVESIETGFTHVASSNFYRTGRVDSSSNRLGIYLAWTPLRELTIDFSAGAGRETVDLATTEYEDDTFMAGVGVTARY